MSRPALDATGLETAILAASGAYDRSDDAVAFDVAVEAAIIAYLSTVADKDAGGVVKASEIAARLKRHAKTMDSHFGPPETMAVPMGWELDEAAALIEAQAATLTERDREIERLRTALDYIAGYDLVDGHTSQVYDITRRARAALAENPS